MVDMGRLFLIHRGTEKVGFDTEVRNKAVNLPVIGRNAVDPAAGFACLELQHPPIFCLVIGQHCVHLLRLFCSYSFLMDQVAQCHPL